MTYNNVLTEEQVREIKKQMALGISMNTLSRGFGVTIGAIQAIREGRSWFRVPWPSGEPGPMPQRIKDRLKEDRRAWVGKKRDYDKRIIESATAKSDDDIFWESLKGLAEPQKNARIWAREASQGEQELSLEACGFLDNFFPGWREAYPELATKAEQLGSPHPAPAKMPLTST